MFWGFVSESPGKASKERGASFHGDRGTILVASFLYEEDTKVSLKPLKQANLTLFLMSFLFEQNVEATASQTRSKKM